MRPLALGLVCLLGCGGAPEAGERLDESALWGDVAPPGEALTFARRGRELLLVHAVADGKVEAVALPEADDPITLLSRTGAPELRAAAEARPRILVPVGELGLPADFGAVHVAAGTNFRAHGDEVGIEEPFLFPKRVAPTPFASPVPPAARLDYEVELCFVALRPLTSADAPGSLGVTLCNDFTDRWRLVRGMLLGPGVMGTRGFADAKGQPGFLPVGAFLVVPDDLERWLAGVQLELFVNGALRQRAPASDMIWGVRELLERSFADREAYRYAGAEVPLLPEPGVLPARALLLSGTPAGVVFRFSNLWRASAYLRPGDEVVARANGLGALQSRVAP
jgi:2-keto-4-pentenoate hydratase/2-oxohepta-3-ene-1,7-dioic acid hydratase in catechol pathway